jgi:hypothetical protein
MAYEPKRVPQDLPGPTPPLILPGYEPSDDFLSIPSIGNGGEKKGNDAQNGANPAHSSQGAGRNGTASNISLLPTQNPEKGEKKGNENSDEVPVDRWLATPISQLVAPTRVLDWNWYGYIAPQQITLFTGLWKSGKSTMLSLLLRDLDGQQKEFCGQAIRPSRVLLVTEETPIKWVQRRDALLIGDHVSVICKPWMVSPSKADWVVSMAKLAQQVKDDHFDVVVFDSIFNLWSVENENDAPEVRAALVPMNMLIEQNAAVLLLAHPTKGDAREGQATRGSGALPAYVNVIMEMRRYDAEHAGDTRRVLTSYTHWDETPPELVVELDRDNMVYRAIGTKGTVKVADRVEVLMEVLANVAGGYTIEEVLQNWPEGCAIPRPGLHTMRRDLEFGSSEAGSKVIRVRGEGKKGDPLRYSRA